MAIKQLHRHLHPQLHPILSEFHKLTGHQLRAVWRVYTEECLDKIVFEFDQDSFVVEAVPEDDTIVFYLISNNDRNTHDWIDASDSVPWMATIGEPFGWGWIIINQQDALDGILISFGGITPQLMLNVMASSIKESIIHQPSE